MISAQHLRRTYYLSASVLTYASTGVTQPVGISGGPYTISESSNENTLIGQIQNQAAGSTLTLVSNLGNRIKLQGNQILVGAAGLDFEAGTPLIAQVREVLGNYDVTTQFTVNVTNVFEQPALQALTLSNDSVPENLANGGAVGNILGKRAGSTLTLTNNAGNRFALVAGAIQRGVTALDFETATSHTIEVTETLADSPNSPRVTQLTINVTNIFEQPNLNALTLSQTTLTINEPVTINIENATVGSVITGSVPPGLTINSAARTITGTPTTANATAAWSLTETLADSANSPRTTSGTLSVGSGNPVTAVAADGVTVTSTVPLTALQPDLDVPVMRQGYDGTYTSPSGVPTPTLKSDILETLKIRHRIRNIYPDDDSEPVWSSTQGAMSDWLYSTDNVPGNASGETSPKPTCGWASTDRTFIGTSGLTVQVVAFHRNARNRQQCAMAVFSATDGTNTIYKAVTETTILTHPGGVHPIAGIRCQGFEATWTTAELDALSAANPGNITVNCKVYPWIGSAASVADSSALTVNDHSEFCPQLYRRDPNRVANPVYAYWSNTGVDATVNASGVATSGADSGFAKVSSDPALAKARPFLTLQNIVVALRAATTLSGGFTDGCEIRVMNSVAWGTTSFPAFTYQNGMCLTITRDPDTTRAAAILTHTSGAAGMRHQFVKFSDITLVRAAATGFSGTVAAGNKVIFENCNIDNASINSPIHATALGSGYYVGNTFTNLSSSAISAGGTVFALIRSCTFASGDSRPEGGVLIGNSLRDNCYPSTTTRNGNRSIIAFNRLLAYTLNSVNPWSFAIVNPVFCMNMVEGIDGVGAQAGFNFSNDGQTFSQPGLIMMENTFAGAMLRYRTNFLYDETPGVYRNHKLIRVAGNVFVCLTTKADYFLGKNGGQNAVEVAQHTRGVYILYGCGFDEIFCQWPDANVVGFGQDHIKRRWGDYASYTLGRNSSRPNGPDGFVEFLNDPKFKANAAVTYTPSLTPLTGTYTSGAGNGDYRPKRVSEGDSVDSPLLGKIANPRFRFGLDGTPRAATNDTIGAYA